jgi:voltage-gated potassium channel
LAQLRPGRFRGRGDASEQNGLVSTDAQTGTPTRDPRLATWERRMNPVIIAAAILPVVVGLTKRGQSGTAVWLDLISWMIFIADFVVHLKWERGYLRSRLGRFDLTIVVLTGPWYLIPALDGARVLGMARLGRLGRVFIVSAKTDVLRELARRLGKAALYSLVLMMCCALVVKTVEPASSGFATYGDALWWAVVTFTTVGYGDYYPVTTTGRIAAVLLMVGGVALIGTLAGSLGSFFTKGTDAQGEPDDDTVDGQRDGAPQLAPGGQFEDRVLAELAALRAEVAELRRSDDA